LINQQFLTFGQTPYRPFDGVKTNKKNKEFEEKSQFLKECIFSFLNTKHQIFVFMETFFPIRKKI